MPTWLVHGFRWPRYPIRIHVIQHNLDDAAPDYVMVPATIDALTQNFKQLYPDIMANLASLQFIEQYDPEEHTISQPYAYVCDQVHEVRLGVDIDEIRGQGVTTDAWSALVDLRDKLAPGNKVGWFVVVNGDVERFAPPIEEPVDSKTPDGFSPTSARSSLGRIEDEEDNCDQAKRQSGLKKWFGGKARKMKSTKDLRGGELAIRTAPLSPPLPNIPHNPAAPLPRAASGKAALPPGTIVR